VAQCLESRRNPTYTEMMRITISIAAVLLALAGAAAQPSPHMISRDLGCIAVLDERAQRICEALAREMEWTWFGHAMISPGWRVTWSSLRRVYCSENIGPEDGHALDLLRRAAPDWRAQSGAEGLIRLARGREDHSEEEPTSIFDPAHSSYILAHGCAGLR
jgi:hypothetical protein